MRQPKRSSLSQLARPAAAMAVVAATLGVAAAPGSAEGPCGTPYFSGDSNRIGNMVWVDTDNDGNYEPGDGETPIAGATVELWIDADYDDVFEPAGDDAGTALCTTTTDGNGHYWFTDVASGKYFVTVTNGVPANHISSTGADAALDTDHTDNGDPIDGFLSVSGAVLVAINDDQPLLEADPLGAPGSDEAIADAANGVTPDANSNLTIDFGFTPVATGPTCVSIGNRVFIDENDNGADDGEAPVANVVLDLVPVDADGNPTGPAIASVRTNGNGYYLFSCVDPGRYIVEIPASQFADDGPLAGMGTATDLADAGSIDLADDGVQQGDSVVSSPIDLTIDGAPAGEIDKPGDVGVDFDAPNDTSSDTTVDFGFVPLTPAPASLGDKVWIDSNANGVQDDGEDPVADVTVYLRNADGDTIATTTTDDAGMYGFGDLAPGDYQVCFDLDTIPADHEVTTANAGGDDAADSDADASTGCTPVVTLAAGENNPTLDLGVTPSITAPPATASLGDKVWFDANENGVQDDDEDPVANVTVYLRNADGDTIATTTTDDAGMYGFGGLEPGDYRVCFDLTTLPAGTVMTTTDANDGASDTIDSDGDPATGCTPVVTLAAGENNPTLDLGIRNASTDLAITKTGRIEGGNAVWTITVTNAAGDAHPGPAVITDTLPSSLRFVSAASSAFACSFAGQTLTCSSNGGLAPGQSGTVTVITSADTSTTCAVSNTASVSSSIADANAANDSATGETRFNCAATRGALPQTGSTTGILVGLATLLGLGGMAFMGYARRERPISIDNRLG